MIAKHKANETANSDARRAEWLKHPGVDRKKNAIIHPLDMGAGGNPKKVDGPGDAKVNKVYNGEQSQESP